VFREQLIQLLVLHCVELVVHQPQPLMISGRQLRRKLFSMESGNATSQRRLHLATSASTKQPVRLKTSANREGQ
jgi:hypothetical protein